MGSVFMLKLMRNRQAADRIIAYHKRHVEQIGLLLTFLRYAYGGNRERWRGRPYPMDN